MVGQPLAQCSRGGYVHDDVAVGRADRLGSAVAARVATASPRPTPVRPPLHQRVLLRHVNVLVLVLRRFAGVADFRRAEVRIRPGTGPRAAAVHFDFD